MTPDETREYMRNYRKEHNVERTEYQRKWREEHPEQVKKHEREYYQRNREKLDEQRREWRVQNPERVAAYSRKSRYGISQQDYEVLLEDCNRSCSICGNAGELHVDHNEQTGQVRALLCPNCNKMIGLAKENIMTLKSAIMYLLCFQEDTN